MVVVYFVVVIVVDDVELDVFVVRLYGRNRENLMGFRIRVKWFVKE